MFDKFIETAKLLNEILVDYYADQSLLNRIRWAFKNKSEFNRRVGEFKNKIYGIIERELDITLLVEFINLVYQYIDKDELSAYRYMLSYFKVDIEHAPDNNDIFRFYIPDYTKDDIMYGVRLSVSSKTLSMHVKVTCKSPNIPVPMNYTYYSHNGYMVDHRYGTTPFLLELQSHILYIMATYLDMLTDDIIFREVNHEETESKTE